MEMSSFSVSKDLVRSYSTLDRVFYPRCEGYAQARALWSKDVSQGASQQGGMAPDSSSEDSLPASVDYALRYFNIHHKYPVMPKGYYIPLKYHILNNKLPYPVPDDNNIEEVPDTPVDDYYSDDEDSVSVINDAYDFLKELKQLLPNTIVNYTLIGFKGPLYVLIYYVSNCLRDIYLATCYADGIRAIVNLSCHITNEHIDPNSFLFTAGSLLFELFARTVVDIVDRNNFNIERRNKEQDAKNIMRERREFWRGYDPGQAVDVAQGAR